MSAKIFDTLAPSILDLIPKHALLVSLRLISFEVHPHVDSLVFSLDSCFQSLTLLCVYDLALALQSSVFYLLTLQG